MQISTANLLATSSNAAALEKGEKVAKGKVESNATANLTKEALPSTVNPQNLKSVITNLLMSLAKEVKSKSAVFEMVQNAPMFKNMGSFSTDFKALIELLKNEPNVSKTLLLLQNFQKSMENLDGKVLKEQVQNSGIFFESKLANKTNNETQLFVAKNLVLELQEHLAHTNKSTVLGKEIENVLNTLSQKVQSSPTELHAELKNILDLFRQSVKQHLSFETTPVLKESYNTVLKLEQALQSMSFLRCKIRQIQSRLNKASPNRLKRF